MSVPNLAARSPSGALPADPPHRKSTTLVSFSTSSSSLSLAPPPMAAASSSRPRMPARGPSDVFKPRFPLDPFASARPGLGEPYFVQVDSLLSLASTAQLRRYVILVFGVPTAQELLPLLHSRHLAHSLVILATHQPPDVPPLILPALRILRLASPLAIEDSGAVRFVNVLEWAERVARLWRASPAAGIIELAEQSDRSGMGELAPPATSRFRQSHSTPVSPGGSSTSVHIASDQATSSPLSIPSSPRTSTYVRPRSQSSNKLLGRPRGPSLPPPDPSQRAFDALINFLPAGIPDKALLKQTILVTTISRPFLAAATPRPACSTASSYLMTSSLSRQTSRERSPRRSVFGALSIGSSRSSVYLPATSPAAVRETGSVSSLTSSPPLPVPEGAAHLVHLLPPSFSERPSRTHAAARQKLVESIEAFLLSFAYPTPLSLEGIKGAAMDMGGGMARGRPYLMPATTFGEPVSGVTVGPVADGHGGEWTVADVLLCSALDREDEPASGPGKAPARQGIAAAMRPRRAWIAGSANVMLVPAPTPSSLPESFFTPPAPAHMPSLPSPREEPFSPRRASGPLQGSPNLAAQQPRPESHPPLQVPPRAQEKPKGRRLSRNFPGRAGQREKDAACKPSATGLPTPPDSDEGSAVEFESVSEPAPALVPVRASVEKIVPTQTVEIVEKASTVGAPGGRKVRWRFWKVRTRA